MSTQSQSRMQELFDAAKADGPSAESRAAMWTGIETASLSIGAGSGGGLGSGGTLAAAKAAIVSSKVVLGLVLGASLMVGVAGAMVVVIMTGAPRAVSPRVQATPYSLERGHLDAKLDDREQAPASPLVITGRVASDQLEIIKTSPDTAATRTGTVTLSEHDRLAREARMVSEARGALHRGDPDLALRIVRGARNQPGARMVPEELTVEAQTLRAMGDEAGAQRIDAELAGKFPSH